MCRADPSDDRYHQRKEHKGGCALVESMLEKHYSFIGAYVLKEGVFEELNDVCGEHVVFQCRDMIEQMEDLKREGIEDFLKIYQSLQERSHDINTRLFFFSRMQAIQWLNHPF